MGKRKRSSRPARTKPRSPAAWRPWIPLLLGFLVYLNALGNQYAYDDTVQLLNNPTVRDLRQAPRALVSPFWAFAEAEREKAGNYYRPIQTLAYMLGYHLFGLQHPLGFHLINLLLHLGSTSLVYWISVRLFGNGWIPLAASALFATHPIHSEAVAWIAGITDVSCTFFFLASFALYLRYDRPPHPRGIPTASVLFFFLALWSKETALALPLVILLYERVLAGSPWRTASGRLVPFGTALAAYLVLRWYALGALSRSQQQFPWGPWQYGEAAVALFGQYLEKLLLPLHLNAYYAFPIQVSAGRLAVSGTLTALFAAALLFGRNRPRALFSLGWIPATLAPVFNLTGIGENLFAERYLYLPSVGFCMAVALAIPWVLGRIRLPAAELEKTCLTLLGILVALYSLRTILRNPDWKDNPTFFTRTVKMSPDAAQIHYGLGLMHMTEPGRIDLARAKEEFQRALDIIQSGRYLVRPETTRNVWNSFGVVLASQGEYEKALGYYEDLVRRYPDEVQYQNNLGFVYLHVGRYREAEERFRKALSLKVNYVDAYSNLARLYDKLERPSDAIASLRMALRYSPENAWVRSELERLEGKKAGKP